MKNLPDFNVTILSEHGIEKNVERLRILTKFDVDFISRISLDRESRTAEPTCLQVDNEVWPFFQSEILYGPGSTREASEKSCRRNGEWSANLLIRT